MDFSKPKIDVYEIVTSRIIELLNQGTIPWQKPWTDSGLPANLISKRPYRGLNVWLLTSLNYDHNLFLTWDQLKKVGGSVKQGEKGHVVIFWKTFPKGDDLEQRGNDKKPTTILRYYKVFNVSQCTDIPDSLIPKKIEREIVPLFECESVISNMSFCPLVQFDKSSAYYDAEKDIIGMPNRNKFKSAESHYLTFFHELIHSTGHKSRLDRKTLSGMAEFGDDMYSLEELVAELGACYLGSLTGILEKEIKSSAAYIQGWLKKLKDDKKFIVFAGSFAQKAVDFILNRPKLDSESNEEAAQPEVLIES